jgi:hypothetical protein
VRDWIDAFIGVAIRLSFIGIILVMLVSVFT